MYLEEIVDNIQLENDRFEWRKPFRQSMMWWGGFVKR